MIQQRVGDLLEVEVDGKYYYLIVLTKIVLFGGNIVFAYHSDGERRALEHLLDDKRGFNVCTDLLGPKRDGTVTRLHRFDDPSKFWMTQYVKQCHAYRPNEKAKEWFIFRADNPAQEPIARVRTLTPDYRSAMDSGCFSFDLVAKKILDRYTPDQNERI